MQTLTLPVTVNDQAFIAPARVAFQLDRKTRRACRDAMTAIAQFSFSEIAVPVSAPVNYDSGYFEKHRILIRPGNLCVLRSESDCGCEYVETVINPEVFN